MTTPETTAAPAAKSTKTNNYFTQLELKFNDKYLTRAQMLVHLNYHVTITAPDGTVIKRGGDFDLKTGKTKRYVVKDPASTIIYEIMDGNCFTQKLSAKAYNESDNWSVFTLKSTTAWTSAEPNHIVDIYIGKSEVAWYLVKVPELMGALVDRLYIHPTTEHDWDILKHNNTHLGEVSRLTALKAGQVLILSESKTSKKLDVYKKEAHEIQLKLNHLSADPHFDGGLYARNFTAFNQILDGKSFVGVVEAKDLHPSMRKKVSDQEEQSWFEKSKEDREHIDAAKTFLASNVEGVKKAYTEILAAYQKEKSMHKGMFTNAQFEAFKQKHAREFAKLESSIGKGVLKLDAGKNTSTGQKLKNIIKKEVKIHGRSTGEMAAYLENLEHAGKAAKTLKAGGWVLMATDVAGGAYDIGHAAETGEYSVGEGSKKRTIHTTTADAFHHEAIVKPLKIGGEIGGAVVADAVVGGVTTAALSTSAGVAVLEGVAVAIGMSTGVLELVVVGAVVVLASAKAISYLGGKGEDAGEWLYEHTK